MKKIISVVLICTLIITSALFGVQAAKKVKLNKSKATIKIGQTISLKVKNTKKKAKWKSSNKNVATVSKKGKVKGKKVGKATITAKVGKKKLKCKVTVVSSATTKPAETVKPIETTKSTETTAPQETTTKEVVNPADWDYRFTESDTAIITGYKGTQLKVTIPSEIDGVKVTGVASPGDMKSGFETLTEIIIPDQILSINMYAFNDCKNLRYVTLPKKIIKIPVSAFSGCDNLEKVVIPDRVTTIEEYAFYGCKSLESIELPEGLSEIGEWAFEGSGIKSINIPSSVKTIKAATFRNCESLAKVTFEYGIKEIVNSAFAGCTQLEEIVFPNSLEYLGGAAGASWMGGVFSDCSKLKKVTIPNSVKIIGEYAFLRCGSLNEIIVPSSVTEICYEPFDKGIILKGTAGSYIETFANENGYTFVAI